MSCCLLSAVWLTVLHIIVPVIWKWLKVQSTDAKHRCWIICFVTDTPTHSRLVPLNIYFIIFCGSSYILVKCLRSNFISFFTAFQSMLEIVGHAWTSGSSSPPSHYQRCVWRCVNTRSPGVPRMHLLALTLVHYKSRIVLPPKVSKIPSGGQGLAGEHVSVIHYR